ncbi:hypothetical protein MCOR07_006785 [Pyricularia oryzae]|nr:hypothetical protein MCOR29_009935 [Pyricularia oryzae]KAI6353931.1 hypothetical protein MCOR32_010686 [Pyricularia oryzae]KAI6428172.1 hypothetical protein MCOR21_005732 [Pyricularia oryzae]KAI6513065.1 hypothetical protein MCOR10_009408 [Pyricularia oryzae]KAI6528551.1 hypothetical protein MCOR05_008382 [Pyricularia oryzae]
MPHQTRPLKKARRRPSSKRPRPTPTPSAGAKNHPKQEPSAAKPPAPKRRRTSRCPDCKAAPLGTLDTPFAHEERLDDGRVKLASYVAERWCAVELCAALGTEPEPDDHNGCYVGEVRVAFAHVDWDGGAEQQHQQQQAVAGEDLGYMLSAAVCEMLDDALEGRLEMGIFADGFGGGEETPEEAGLVAPLCLRVVDDEPVSPRTVPAGFERGWFLSLGDETPESTESESPDSEIFARQV